MRDQRMFSSGRDEFRMVAQTLRSEHTGRKKVKLRRHAGQTAFSRRKRADLTGCNTDFALLDAAISLSPIWTAEIGSRGFYHRPRIREIREFARFHRRQERLRAPPHWASTSASAAHTIAWPGPFEPDMVWLMA
jgi:hypothetical protein